MSIIFFCLAQFTLFFATTLCLTKPTILGHIGILYTFTYFSISVMSPSGVIGNQCNFHRVSALLPFPSSTMAFTAYTTPHALTRFSAQFFARTTVAAASELVRNDELPHILPKNSVQKWIFDGMIPVAISEIIVGAEEQIPCLDDLLPITQNIEAAFHQEGARSIYLQVGQTFVRYHLSKVRPPKETKNAIFMLYLASDTPHYRHQQPGLQPPQHGESLRSCGLVFAPHPGPH